MVPSRAQVVSLHVNATVCAARGHTGRRSSPASAQSNGAPPAPQLNPHLSFKGLLVARCGCCWSLRGVSEPVRYYRSGSEPLVLGYGPLTKQYIVQLRKHQRVFERRPPSQPHACRRCRGPSAGLANPSTRLPPLQPARRPGSAWPGPLLKRPPMRLNPA